MQYTVGKFKNILQVCSSVAGVYCFGILYWAVVFSSCNEELKK